MLQNSSFSHWYLDFSPKKKKAKNFRPPSAAEVFSYVRGICGTPGSYPHDILKNPKSYVRNGTRGGKKKLTPSEIRKAVKQLK